VLAHARMMALPDEAALSPATRRLAGRLAGLVSDARPAVMTPVEAWLVSGPVARHDTGAFQVDELAHELSPWMAPHVSEAGVDGRSLVELDVLIGGRLPTVDGVLAEGAKGFARLVVQMHELLVADGLGFRTTAVGSVPDRKGERVVYPPPDAISGQLEAVWKHWACHVDQSPGFAAVVAMTALMNLHPFADGNGRVGRVLFHWTLNRHRAEPVYLPLYELSAMSECGYLIRLRQAQYHDEWEPLLCYLVMVAARLLGDLGSHLECSG